MRVYLVHPDEIVDTRLSNGYPYRAFNQVLEDARHNKNQRHRLCASARDADMIIAPVNDGLYGPFFEKLRASNLFSSYRTKLLIYSPDDNQHPAVPGLFPSCSLVWKKLRQATAAHYRSEHFPRLCFSDSDVAHKDLLCSFVGSVRSHPIRSEIMKLKCPASVFHDASSFGWWWERSVEEQEPYVSFYRDIAARSRFILCPRGASTSSIRIYEAMEAGAVPVIVADGIVLPEGPDWSAFSIRVGNARVREIPQIIVRCEPLALEMGRIARATWKKFFSPESSFNSLVDWGKRLLEERSGMNASIASSLAMISPVLRPLYLRRKVEFWTRENRRSLA